MSWETRETVARLEDVVFVLRDPDTGKLYWIEDYPTTLAGAKSFDHRDLHALTDMSPLSEWYEREQDAWQDFLRKAREALDNV